MSFLKYSDDVDIRAGNGRGSLSFSRAHVDNMPFRGPSIPLKDEEYNQYTEVVNDVGVEIFDMRNPEEKAKLREILDRAGNGWYNIYDLDKKWGKTQDGKVTIFVFVMYAVPHRELAKKRAQAEMLPSPVPTFPVRS